MPISASTSNLESDLLRRRAVIHDKVIADVIGQDVTFVSRFFSGERGLRINQIQSALETLGLKIVPADEVSISQKEIDSLRHLAMLYLESGSNGR